MLLQIRREDDFRARNFKKQGNEIDLSTVTRRGIAGKYMTLVELLGKTELELLFT